MTSSSSSGEYYITCFRCINSFRDRRGVVVDGAAAYNAGLVDSGAGGSGSGGGGSNRFFRDETSSAIRAVNRSRAD